MFVDTHVVRVVASGSEQLASSSEAGKLQASSSAGGVNRRTAVLFGNKAPRRSIPRVSAQSPSSGSTQPAPRRPGRPPKQPVLAVSSDAVKSSGKSSEKKHVLASEPEETVPKKRGRKKRSAVESSGGGGEFGSRWGEIVGTITAEWSSVAHDRETSSSAKRTPQKESFRQYRVMHDSDHEGAAKSDNDRQAVSLSSSSSTDSSDSDNSSSHSDNDEGGEDGSSSSSSSSPGNSSLTHSARNSLSVSVSYLCV